MITNNYLFVYGTLLNEAYEFGRYLKSTCIYFAEGRFKGRLYDIGEYPGAIADVDCMGYVYGSVYLMNDAEDVLKRLDEYEGFGEEQEQPNLFVRKIVNIETDGKEMQCWVYLYNLKTKNLPRILSGRYPCR